MSKLSPGPWKALIGDWSEVVDANGAVLLRFRTGYSQADVRLIAAAPDLLEVAHETECLLRAVEGISRNNLEQLAHEVGEKLRAAIAKTEGRSHD